MEKKNEQINSTQFNSNSNSQNFGWKACFLNLRSNHRTLLSLSHTLSLPPEMNYNINQINFFLLPFTSLGSPLDLCQFSISTHIWCSADVFATMGSNKYAYVYNGKRERVWECMCRKHINIHKGPREMCDFTRLSDIWLTFFSLSLSHFCGLVYACVNMCELCVWVDLFRLILPIFIFRRRILWILFWYV